MLTYSAINCKSSQLEKKNLRDRNELAKKNEKRKSKLKAA